MSAHTPGPWKVFTTKDGNKVIGIGDVNAEGVADCGFGVWRGGDAEALANAKLMAAAPEMLAALKQVVEASRSGRDTVNFLIELNQLARLCARTVARAEGEV